MLEIDCPDCGGKILTKHKGMSHYVYNKCINSNCKDGKIKVYTEKELQEAIKQERENNISACLEVATKFTENTDNHTVALSCAEAIREME